jgi:hypothetical protein
MTLVADLADRGINPAESPYDCWLEVDRAENEAIICWRENLEFHAELAKSEEGTFPKWTFVNSWDSLTDEYGFLKAEVIAALRDELARLLPQGCQVYADDTAGDEIEVGFEIVTEYREGETYEAWLDRIGWPVIAELINCTDPGTFNHPYLFSAILYHEIGVKQ